MSADLLIILLLVLANGVFSMSEMAVVAARKARLEQRADAGDAGARAALTLANTPSRFLSTVQLSITLIGIIAGPSAARLCPRRSPLACARSRSLRHIATPWASASSCCSSPTSRWSWENSSPSAWPSTTPNAWRLWWPVPWVALRHRRAPSEGPERLDRPPAAAAARAGPRTRR
jgi:hypothetical protein